MVVGKENIQHTIGCKPLCGAYATYNRSQLMGFIAECLTISFTWYITLINSAHRIDMIHEQWTTFHKFMQCNALQFVAIQNFILTMSQNSLTHVSIYTNTLIW
jgi:hypothetical protein